MTTPYTYRLTHIKSGKHYYGARYAKGCNHEDFWKRYFTSSKVIHNIIRSEGKNAFSFEIRKVFDSPMSCIAWERKVLTRLKVWKNENWFNLVVSYLPSDEESKIRYEQRFGTTTPQFLPKIDAKRKRTSLERYGYDRPQKSPEVRNKIKSTNLERYGVECVFSSPEFRRKIKETIKKKYGVDHHFQSDEIKQKVSVTNLERYGVESVMSNETVRKKCIATTFDRYGVECIFNLPEVREKANKVWEENFSVGAPKHEEMENRKKQTSMHKYGVSHYTMTEEYKEKVRTTSLLKYGTERPCQNQDIISRIKESKLKNLPIICQKCGIEVFDYSAYSQYHGDKCSWKPIQCVDTGQVFNKRSDLVSFLLTLSDKATYNAIRNVCLGKTQKAYGFRWMCVEDC